MHTLHISSISGEKSAYFIDFYVNIMHLIKIEIYIYIFNNMEYKTQYLTLILYLT